MGIKVCKLYRPFTAFNQQGDYGDKQIEAEKGKEEAEAITTASGIT
jgi:hypothetical protein